MILLVSTAFALGSDEMMLIVECMNEVHSVYPEAEATQVPYDVAPVAHVTWCAETDSALARLWQGDELLFEERFVSDGLSLGVVEPDVALEKDTAYTWVVSPAVGEERIIEFETGSELHEAVDEPPVLRSHGEGWQRVQGTGWLSLVVAPSPQPEGNTAAFELLDEAGEVVERSVQWEAGGEASFYLDLTERPQDICFSARQRQPDGTWLESEVICEEKIGGCSTGGLAPSMLLGLFALLGIRRRR